jgi:transcriptional regulator CtsR
MNDMDVFVRKSANYRIWVDETGVGRIRILKRINFTTLVAIFEELHGEIKKRISENIGKVHIVFYISKSLYEEMSINAKEFLGFCQSCMGIKFELVLIEM